MKYVLIRSWHAITDFDATHVRTRCGRVVRTVGELDTATEGPQRVHATAPELPLSDKSCETCLRLTQ